MSYELCEKIRSLEPYEPSTGEYKIRLDANESYMNFSENVMKSFAERVSALAFNRYPDPTAGEICRLFADFYDLPAECVAAGNGSDELLSIIIQSMLMKGEKMAVAEPDFSMYSFYAHIAEAQVLVENRVNGVFDIDKIADFINCNGVKLYIFSNPCNPTGGGIDACEVIRLTALCPDCLIIADEAYMDFWNQSVLSYAGKLQNLLVLKTCSKAFGAAAIRCGFAIGTPAVIRAIKAVKSPYNVSTLTQAAAAALLEHPDELRQRIAEINKQRDSLYEGIFKLAEKTGRFTVGETHTNFVLLQMDKALALEIFEQLKLSGIIIRCFGDKLRITAGSEGENTELLNALERILA